jgi:hypothetical protein
MALTTILSGIFNKIAADLAAIKTSLNLKLNKNQITSTDQFDVATDGTISIKSAYIQSMIDLSLVPIQADINSRMKFAKIIEFSFALDFPSVAAGTTSSPILRTITGAVAGDIVLIGNSSNKDGSITIDGLIKSANNAEFRAFNGSSAAIDNLNGTYFGIVYRKASV